MLKFMLRRSLMAVPTLIAVSIVAFIIIQLPPGDYLTSYIANLRATGDVVDQAEIEALGERYGLGQPFYVQYFRWMVGILHGDFGYSMEWRVSVSSLIWERLALTLVLSLSTLIFTWMLAIPIGIISATKQYSIFDYVSTFFGFVGLGIPDFYAGAGPHVDRLCLL